MTLIDKAEALAAIEDLFITADNDREEGYDEGVAACLEAIAALQAQVREMALDVLAASGQAQEAYQAQLAAEAQIAALTARVEGLTGALRKAEQDFYEAANRFQDEDYEGPHEKFTVNVVCHIKPYFDMNMKHLRDSAAAARAALSATTEEGHE